jgi:hypothetical protein
VGSNVTETAFVPPPGVEPGVSRLGIPCSTTVPKENVLLAVPCRSTIFPYYHIIPHQRERRPRLSYLSWRLLSPVGRSSERETSTTLKPLKDNLSIHTQRVPRSLRGLQCNRDSLLCLRRGLNPGSLGWESPVLPLCQREISYWLSQ